MSAVIHGWESFRLGVLQGMFASILRFMVVLNSSHRSSVVLSTGSVYLSCSALMSSLIWSQLARLNSEMGRTAFFRVSGLTMNSKYTMSWSVIPGMLSMRGIREGELVNTRSNMLAIRVGSLDICSSPMSCIFSMSHSCWAGYGALGFSDIVSQFQPGRLKSPATRRLLLFYATRCSDVTSIWRPASSDTSGR